MAHSVCLEPVSGLSVDSKEAKECAPLGPLTQLRVGIDLMRAVKSGLLPHFEIPDCLWTVIEQYMDAGASKGMCEELVLSFTPAWSEPWECRSFMDKGWAIFKWSLQLAACMRWPLPSEKRKKQRAGALGKMRRWLNIIHGQNATQAVPWLLHCALRHQNSLEKSLCRAHIKPWKDHSSVWSLDCAKPFHGKGKRSRILCHATETKQHWTNIGEVQRQLLERWSDTWPLMEQVLEGLKGHIHEGARQSKQQKEDDRILHHMNSFMAAMTLCPPLARGSSSAGQRLDQLYYRVTWERPRKEPRTGGLR